ncbi:hypothetical protein ACLI4B_16525, partial [Pseudomonas aeruginosa]
PPVAPGRNRSLCVWDGVVRGEQVGGSVRGRWGNEPKQQCLVDYALGPRETTLPGLQLACRPASAADRERTL